MIFVTGDTHGEYRRFGTEIFTEQRHMTKDDYVIICGDFGIWDNSRQENYWFDWLDKKPYTTLFVTGNHSNYELLKTFPVRKWHGGNVQFIRPSLIHLMRGQVYEIAGKRFFTMGGASSHDITDGILEPDAPNFREQKKRLNARGALYRINHVSWWKEELPDDTEYETALSNLEACGWNVDYIITHCCPSSIEDRIGKEACQHDRLTDFFDTIKDKCEFRCWFFGHYHENRIIDEKYVLLYEQIIQMC